MSPSKKNLHGNISDLHVKDKNQDQLNYNTCFPAFQRGQVCWVLSCFWAFRGGSLACSLIKSISYSLRLRRPQGVLRAFTNMEDLTTQSQNQAEAIYKVLTVFPLHSALHQTFPGIGRYTVNLELWVEEKMLFHCYLMKNLPHFLNLNKTLLLTVYVFWNLVHCNFFSQIAV